MKKEADTSQSVHLREPWATLETQGSTVELSQVPHEVLFDASQLHSQVNDPEPPDILCPSVASSE